MDKGKHGRGGKIKTTMEERKKEGRKVKVGRRQ